MAGATRILRRRTVPPEPKRRPHTRAIGSTFEHAFILPKPANAGNTHTQKPKATNPIQKTRPVTAKHKIATNATRPRLTEEQKRELKRVRAAEERQRRKELGLCKDCSNPGIKGQTRCPDCAEIHRLSRCRQRQAVHT